MFYNKFVTKIYSKVKKMQQPKVYKAQAQKMNFIDKMLGSGESRVMFR